MESGQRRSLGAADRCCEGIVSKRLGSPYRTGRSPHCVKVKNPKASAVTSKAGLVDAQWCVLLVRVPPI